MQKFKVTNDKTNESFVIEHWCIHVARDDVEEGIKERKWNKEDCTVI